MGGSNSALKRYANDLSDSKNDTFQIVPHLDLTPTRKYTEDQGIMAAHLGSDEDSDGFSDGEDEITSPLLRSAAKRGGMIRLYSANVGGDDEGPLTPLKHNTFP